MPRPKTKKELLAASEKNFQALIDLIASYPEAEREKYFTPDKLYQNIRDIVAHLHHWNTLMCDWYEVGMKGEKPAIPAPDYTWKTLPDYNRLIWEQYTSTPLKEALSLFKASFKKVFKLIEQHSQKELFEKKKYHWTGTTSLAAYLISCTSSHYDWAIKRIKKSMKTVT